MNSELLIQITLSVITIIGAMITYVLIPFIKSKTTAAQQEKILFWVQLAVDAAEQIFNIHGMGKEKKHYVMDFMNSKGIQLNECQLDVLIESAVYQLNLAKTVCN